MKKIIFLLIIISINVFPQFNQWKFGRTAEPTFKGLTLSNYLTISTGYADADSFRLNGTTALTKGTWHSGIGASSMGAVTLASLTSQGAVSGTTYTGTTGTFVTASNTNNLYLRRNSTTVADYAELAFGVSTASLYHASIRSVRNVSGALGNLVFLTQKNTGAGYSALEQRFGITSYGELQVYNTGTPSTFLDSNKNATLNTISSGAIHSTTKSDFDSVLVDGDIDITLRPYAELFYNDSTYALTMTTQSVWYTLKKFNQTGLHTNTTWTDSTIVCSKAGVYKLSGTLSFAANNPNELIHVAYFVNDVLVTKSVAQQDMATAGNIYNYAPRCLMSLAVNDVVKIKVKNDTSAGKIATFNHGNWGIEKIN